MSGLRSRTDRLKRSPLPRRIEQLPTDLPSRLKPSPNLPSARSSDYAPPLPGLSEDRNDPTAVRYLKLQAIGGFHHSNVFQLSYEIDPTIQTHVDWFADGPI